MPPVCLRIPAPPGERRPRILQAALKALRWGENNRPLIKGSRRKAGAALLGEIFQFRLPFSKGHIPGGLRELAELPVSYLCLVHPEACDLDLPDRCLLGKFLAAERRVEAPLRAHPIGPPWNPDHPVPLLRPRFNGSLAGGEKRGEQAKQDCKIFPGHAAKSTATPAHFHPKSQSPALRFLIREKAR